MTARLTCWLFPLVVGGGCAAPLSGTARSPADTAPSFTITALQLDEATGVLRPLQSPKPFRKGKPITLEIRVDRPAFVAVALYAAAGESTNLRSEGENSAVLPGSPLRVAVPPQVPPPGVEESELRVFVAASAVSLSGELRQLLHLRCQDGVDGGRGDRDRSEKPTEKRLSKEEKKEEKKEERTGRPAEGQRGPCTAFAACPVPSGLSSPMTVRALVLLSN